MNYRYYLIEVPAEFVEEPVAPAGLHGRVQVFTQQSPGVFDYLMDLSKLQRICQAQGWNTPTGGDWCEFPLPLESFDEKENNFSK